MATERRVHIQTTDQSILDNEFSNIRERFDAEMRRMEDEMARFRTELMNHERDSFTRPEQLRRTDMHRWLDTYDSPLIQDSGSGKQLKLRFDVSQYKPAEILVKTVDNRLQVHAKHEEKTENRSVYRDYTREFLLPKGTNPDLIRSSLSRDGVLTIEAPLPDLGLNRERMIPIDKK